MRSKDSAWRAGFRGIDRACLTCVKPATLATVWRARRLAPIGGDPCVTPGYPGFTQFVDLSRNSWFRTFPGQLSAGVVSGLKRAFESHCASAPIETLADPFPMFVSPNDRSETPVDHSQDHALVQRNNHASSAYIRLNSAK